MLVTAVGSTHWWFIGIGIGFAIVVVVVIVASTILALAGRIGNQAKEGIVVMDEARQFTVPVWQVQRTNALLTVIWKSAEAARESLEEARR
ncbi:MAG TPA: hypothetical protein VG294_02120 [Solirubrobacteraceae bacterium]|jgi:hypothetical protein|nr:hypothetical protein [Solirubrobacteraceae bacterium]